jgi:hypothetical protein
MAFAFATLGFLSALVLHALAASFPPTPEGVSVVNSTNFPGVSISYKEVSPATSQDTSLYPYQSADGSKDNYL